MVGRGSGVKGRACWADARVRPYGSEYKAASRTMLAARRFRSVGRLLERLGIAQYCPMPVVLSILY